MIHAIHLIAQSIDLTTLPKTHATSTEFGNILSIVWAVIGAVALLVITVGGFRYIIAQGEPQKVAQARNTIIYAAIGLVVAASAEAIVAFVFGQV
jgi:hypothetical protein